MTKTTLRIVANGMPTFHHVAVLFVRANARMPRKFTDETSAIGTTATTRPPWVGKPCELRQPPANAWASRSRSWPRPRRTPPSRPATRRTSRAMLPQTTQEVIAAGPAGTRAVFAPTGQPEPMIDPIDTLSGETAPIWLRSDLESLGVGCAGAMTATTELHFSRRPDSCRNFRTRVAAPEERRVA
jgi:hypothetical protein